MTITEKDAGRKVKVRDGWIVTIMENRGALAKENPFSYVHPQDGFISVSSSGSYLSGYESNYDIVGFYETE